MSQFLDVRLARFPTGKAFAQLSWPSMHQPAWRGKQKNGRHTLTQADQAPEDGRRAIRVAITGYSCNRRVATPS
jgi:hypothetical protein